jgi:hypothetical protein
MMKRFLGWNTLSRLAGVLCLAPPVIAFTILNGDGFGDVTWIGVLTTCVASVVIAPALSAPQLAMLFLIRRSRSSTLKISFLGASFAMACVYRWFLQTADLSSTSTAGLAAMFFPLYLGCGSLAAGAVILWLQRLVAGQID